MRSTILFTLVVVLLSLWSDSAHAQQEFRLHSVFAHDVNSGVTFHHVVPDNLKKIFPSGNISLSQKRDAASPIPDVTSASVLRLFAAMSYDAYEPPGSADWIPLGVWENGNHSYTFGWGNVYLRGYLFYNGRNEAIIAFKGTNILGDTATQDTTQDWLLFSGCGESNNFNYDCGCLYSNPQGQEICSISCYRDCIRIRYVSYLDMARQVYAASRQIYPDANFYFTGHSLGGAVAALLSANGTGVPAVTFESPPSRNYAWFAGLDVSVASTPVTPVFNFGAFNDAIFCGGDACWPCSEGGAPIKTRCHIGYSCVWPLGRDYDYGWSSQTYAAHKIQAVFDRLDELPVPDCVAFPECRDCVGHGWEMW